VRIGIDEAAYRAVLGSDFRLDPSPRVIVASDDDFAFHGNAHALKLLVVFRNTVVDVDKRRSTSPSMEYALYVGAARLLIK
jgi:hypothetical protein